MALPHRQAWLQVALDEFLSILLIACFYTVFCLFIYRVFIQHARALSIRRLINTDVTFSHVIYI